jgi:enterochelin esterase-like enzyme
MGTNLLVLVAAAVLLNNEYGFYADWTDVRNATFGGKPPATMTHAGALPAAPDDPATAVLDTGPPTNLPLGGGDTGPLPTLPPGGAAGRVRSFTVTGAESGLTGTILLVLPTDYFDPKNATRHYPVLETFSGYPGTPAQWPDGMHLTSTLDKAVHQGDVAPTITVSPTLEFPGGIDTECVDGPDRKVETWVTRDVPAWVSAHLRVLAAPTGWATIGISSGAWCAAMSTMLHPEQYAGAIVLGGYFRPQFSSTYKPFPSESPQGTRYDLVRLAHRAPPPVDLWVETSHADGLSYPSTSALLSVAQPPLSVDAVVLDHAGHRASLWIDELPTTLRWLGTHVPGFSTNGL